MERDGERIGHVRHQREVEQLGMVELVFEPTGIGAIVFSYDAGQRAPLRGLIGGLSNRTRLRGRLGRGLSGRERSDRGDDDARQRRDDEQQLGQPEQQSHPTRMPPSRATLGAAAFPR